MATPEQMQQIMQFKGAFYQRPGSVKIPTVWMRFEGKTPRADGMYPKFRIEDVTEDRIPEILSCATPFTEQVLVMKTLSKMDLGIENVAEKQADQILHLWMLMLKDQVSLQCVTDDEETPRLVGFNVNEVATNIKPCYMGEEGPIEMAAVAESSMKVRNDINLFKSWNVDKYLDAWGLFVKTEFRGQGVAHRLLAARKPLCKALGIKATGNTFGSDIAIRAAERAGFQLLNKITFEEIERKYSIRLPGAEHGSFQFWGVQYEE